MAKRESQPTTRKTSGLLRRADQAVVALVLAISLTVLGWSLASRQLRQQKLVDIDRAEPTSIAFTVDINQADWPELVQLPGVGETLARRIVEVRQTDGPYLDHNDLRRRVSGIGTLKLEQMRPYLRPVPSAENVAGPQAGTPGSS